jgi:choline dehydrogenase-like flavoprotein
MAPLEAGGVVDGDTRVHGTKNLFVVDNSICPEIPDINTTVSALMIGFRGSEIIKEIYCNKKSTVKETALEYCPL